MASVSASYLQSLFSLTVISVLVVCSLQAYDCRMRTGSESAALTKLIEGVATEAWEAQNLAQVTNSSIQLIICLPERIGEKPYWIKASNNTSESWLEAGFGDGSTQDQCSKVYMARDIAASGIYKSEDGALKLLCHESGSTIYLELAVQRGG